MAGLINVLSVNQETLRMYNAADLAELTGYLGELFEDNQYVGFHRELG